MSDNSKRRKVDARPSASGDSKNGNRDASSMAKITSLFSRSVHAHMAAFLDVSSLVCLANSSSAWQWLLDVDNLSTTAPLDNLDLRYIGDFNIPDIPNKYELTNKQRKKAEKEYDDRRNRAKQRLTQFLGFLKRVGKRAKRLVLDGLPEKGVILEADHAAYFDCGRLRELSVRCGYIMLDFVRALVKEACSMTTQPSSLVSFHTGSSIWLRLGEYGLYVPPPTRPPPNGFRVNGSMQVHVGLKIDTDFQGRPDHRVVWQLQGTCQGRGRGKDGENKCLKPTEYPLHDKVDWNTPTMDAASAGGQGKVYWQTNYLPFPGLFMCFGCSRTLCEECLGQGVEEREPSKKTKPGIEWNLHLPGTCDRARFCGTYTYCHDCRPLKPSGRVRGGHRTVEMLCEPCIHARERES